MKQKNALISHLIREPIIPAAPLAALLVAFHFTTAPIEASVYTVRGWAWGVSAVFIVGPVAGACAAIIIGRLRDAGIFERTWERSRGTIIVQSLMVTVTVSFLLLVVFGLSQAGLSLPDWRILVAGFFGLIQIMSLGTILGYIIPTAIAAPLTLLVGYLWMVLPATVENPWIRHLSGHWPTCCAVDQVPSLDALHGVGLLALSGIVLTVSILANRRTPVRLIGVGVAGILIANAISSASALGYDPIEARTTDLVCSDIDHSTSLCMYPEHVEQRDLASRTIIHAQESWRNVLPVDGLQYTEFGYSSDPYSRFAIFAPGLKPEDAIFAVAHSHLPPAPQCIGEPYEGGESFDQALAVLVALDQGISFAESNISMTEKDAAVVYSVLELPADKQRLWIEGTFDQIRSCSKIDSTS